MSHTKNVVIVDHNTLEGRINARLLTSSDKNVRAMDFVSPEAAYDYLERVNIMPDIVIISETFSSKMSEINEWVSNCPKRCEIYTMEDEAFREIDNVEKRVSRAMLYDHVSRILQN